MAAALTLGTGKVPRPSRAVGLNRLARKMPDRCEASSEWFAQGEDGRGTDRSEGLIRGPQSRDAPLGSEGSIPTTSDDEREEIRMPESCCYPERYPEAEDIGAARGIRTPDPLITNEGDVSNLNALAVV